MFSCFREELIGLKVLAFSQNLWFQTLSRNALTFPLVSITMFSREFKLKLSLCHNIVFQVKEYRRVAGGRGSKHDSKQEGLRCEYGGHVGDSVWSMSLMSYWPCYMSDCSQPSHPGQPLGLRRVSGCSLLVLGVKFQGFAFWFTGKKGKLHSFRLSIQTTQHQW